MTPADGAAPGPCPSIRCEQLDSLVLDAIEARLARDRLRTLLAGVLDVSQSRQVEGDADRTRSYSERTRLNTAISNLLILIEEWTMSARDPAFVERMTTNRAALLRPGVVPHRGQRWALRSLENFAAPRVVPYSGYGRPAMARIHAIALPTV